MRSRCRESESVSAVREVLPNSKPPRSAARWILEQLEPRMLLSADPVSAALGDVASLLPGMGQADDPESRSDALHELVNGVFTTGLQTALNADSQTQGAAPFALDPLARAIAQAVPGQEPADIATSTVTESNPATQPLDLDALVAPLDTTSNAHIRELVIVDLSTPNYQQLVDDLQQRSAAGTLDIVLLDSDRDGIEQISAALARYDGLDAVHIVSHGDDGTVQLGNTVLTQENLGQYAQAITDWGDALGEQADLLFYGCNLAASADGQALVQGLASLSGADVAASTDLTGAAALGGDWDLEYRAGSIESGIVFSSALQQNWSNTLAVVEVTTTNDIADGGVTTSIAALLATPGFDGISLREAVIATNNTVGADQIVLGAGTFSLSNGAGEDFAALGDLDIRDTLTISGIHHRRRDQ